MRVGRRRNGASVFTSRSNRQLIAELVKGRPNEQIHAHAPSHSENQAGSCSMTAAELWGGSPDEILDSVLLGFMSDDGGELLARQESLNALKKMFGNNQG